MDHSNKEWGSYFQIPPEAKILGFKHGDIKVEVQDGDIQSAWNKLKSVILRRLDMVIEIEDAKEKMRAHEIDEAANNDAISKFYASLEYNVDQHTQSLYEEIKSLKQQIARLTAPVTDEELEVSSRKLWNESLRFMTKSEYPLEYYCRITKQALEAFLAQRSK